MLILKKGKRMGQ